MSVAPSGHGEKNDHLCDDSKRRSHKEVRSGPFHGKVFRTLKVKVVEPWPTLNSPKRY